MTTTAAAQLVASPAEPLWFLGTLVRPKLVGEQTAGRFGLWEGVLPRGAAPPLHSHPQDETFYVLEGTVTIWIVEPELLAGAGSASNWQDTRGRRCSAGDVAYAPGGTAHTFLITSDTARMLFLSTPAGIEAFVSALAEPARWPWLQPPPEGPRVPPERLAATEREHGVIRHGPPPT